LQCQLVTADTYLKRELMNFTAQVGLLLQAGFNSKHFDDDDYYHIALQSID
jgi:hypothetical protein